MNQALHHHLVRVVLNHRLQAVHLVTCHHLAQVAVNPVVFLQAVANHQ